MTDPTRRYRTVPEIRQAMVREVADQMRRDMNLPPFKWPSL